MTDSPDPIDIHVGAMLRRIRKGAGMSQEKVAAGLGLTFQQVQKYERGTNRMSASKLYQASRLLGVGVHRFFDGIPADSAEPDVDDGAFAALISGGADFPQMPRLLALDPKKRLAIGQIVDMLTSAPAEPEGAADAG